METVVEGVELSGACCTDLSPLTRQREELMMRKAVAASAIIHFGLIAGATIMLNLPPAVDESDTESISVTLISMDMVSTDPSDVVTQTSQTIVSAGDKHEAMEVPEVPVAEAVTEQSVEPTDTLKPSQSDPLEQLSAASINDPGAEAARQKLTETLVAQAETTPTPPSPIEHDPVEAVETPKKKIEPKPKPRQPSQQANLGNGGAAQADTTASSVSGGGQGKKDDGGGAAASKYEGQVQAKVNRAVRKVATSRGGRGILRFALGANGNVLSVSILDSSGDPAVDAAAVTAVQRAAPYPAIPPATGKTSWSFGLPFGDK